MLKRKDLRLGDIKALKTRFARLIEVYSYLNKQKRKKATIKLYELNKEIKLLENWSRILFLRGFPQLGQTKVFKCFDQIAQGLFS